MSTSLYKKFEHFFERYERRISSFSLVAGFVIDNLTIRRIDVLWDNLLITAYICIAAASICILNMYEAGKLKKPFFHHLHPWLLVFVQFCFGGLFSNFVVFYFRSASLAASWLFVILLVALLIGNELFKKYYQRTAFQITIFFFTVFSYCIFLVPILTHKMGPTIFLISGGVSLVLIFLFVLFLRLLVPLRVREAKRYILVSVLTVYGVITFLYFANIIPPIPLSLKDAAAYQSVVRTTNGYVVAEEKGNSKGIFSFKQTIHIMAGKPVYVFSSVFAPTALNTTIVHDWQYYDEKTRVWKSLSRIPFSIVGGRDGGYRGYSMKSNVFPGLWRVNVETDRGQLIGRVKFTIEFVTSTPELETIVKS